MKKKKEAEKAKAAEAAAAKQKALDDLVNKLGGKDVVYCDEN